MAPWTQGALAAFLAFLLCRAHADWLSLPANWSFSQNLSFPSSSSSLNSYTDIAPFSVFQPIVSSPSFSAGSKGFSLGFLSLFDSPASSPSRIYLCVCLGVRKDGPSGRPFLVPVWTLNPTSPLQQQGQSGFVKLEVDDSEQIMLRLEDGEGDIVVWNQSNNIRSMEMQDTGNLVLRDPLNQTIWQSFSFPSDTLLQGQQLRLHAELTSRNQMYKAVMQPGGFQFSYLVQDSASQPLVYWIFAANVTVSNYFEGAVNLLPLDARAPINLTAAMALQSCEESNDPYAALDGETLDLWGACGARNSWDYGTSDLIRLDDDGNVRDYYLSQSANSSYIMTSSREEYKPCHAPNVCGAYGICTANVTNDINIQHSCRCPSDKDNKSLDGAFRPIDVLNPSQGCERTENLECKTDSSSQAQLVEIKSVASIAMLSLFELTWKENSMPLEDCKASCASSCSCTGFLYHTKSTFCLKFGDNTGISNLSLISLTSSDDHVAYLKIQPKMQQLQPKSSPSNAGKHRRILLVAMILLALFFTASAGAVLVCRKTKKQRADPAVEIAEQQLLGVMPTLPTRFSYEELSRITSGFATRLGSGGFGSVYAGVDPSDGGTRVAVKKLEFLSHGQKQFLAEIATIGGIRHINIVRLYGFCLEKQHRLLVYEYMENGSLDKWLFGKQQEPHSPILSWEKRFCVALGMARGLAFLHEECPQPILHFDVKPENILLDRDFNAKLADFGLSKLVVNGESSAWTVVRGTPGYIAPEWVTHSLVSKKCDVYSFGMVLLELVSGTRNAEAELSSEAYFPKWAAKKTREGNVGELLDKRLLSTNCEERSVGEMIEDTVLEQVTTVVAVALMCISDRPDMRPTMTGACGMLEGSVAIPKDIVPGMAIEAPAFGVSYSTFSSSRSEGMSSTSNYEPQ